MLDDCGHTSSIANMAAHVIWEIGLRASPALGYNKDMIETILSQNKIPIRLTDERWAHITEEHCELAGMRLEVLEAIENPSRILAGGEEELLGIREIEKGKFLVVVYRELNNDGFIITAFLTRRIKSLNRRKQIWPK